MNLHWIERLSEYEDGELSPAERAQCEAHLAECSVCRDALADVRQLISMAKTDPDVMPPADLWPGVQQRISRISSARRISFTLPQLALAASLLIAVSAGVAYVAAGRAMSPPTPSPRSAPAEPPIQAMAEPVLPPSADVPPVNFADAQFDRAVSDLERILGEERGTLDPGTVMVIERNLAVIDEAIQQARTALAADPANPFLNSHLADARRRKLDLLRHATTLNSAGD